MIAYRYVTLPENLTAGFVIEERKPPQPAMFLRPSVAKAIYVHETTRLTIAKIQAAVADYYGISPIHMNSKSKDRNHVYPRQMAMLLSRELVKASLTQIAIRFGRDHTTVMHSIKAVQKRVKENDNTEAEYVTLRAKLAA